MDGTIARIARLFFDIRKYRRDTMRNIFMTSVAALCLVAVPGLATAQSAVPGSINTTADKRPDHQMTKEQQAEYDAWTVEKRTMYDSWTPDYQVYYWTLAPQQQIGYWALTPDQRGMIYKMTPEQRVKAWSSISAQLAGRTPATPSDQANPPGNGIPTTGVPDPQTANQTVRPSFPADATYQGGPYKGALTPPPANAMNKVYPVCKGAIQDSCINPREAGKNWGNRPLDHWPGKPASEMGG